MGGAHPGGSRQHPVRVGGLTRGRPGSGTVPSRCPKRSRLSRRAPWGVSRRRRGVGTSGGHPRTRVRAPVALAQHPAARRPSSSPGQTPALASVPAGGPCRLRARLPTAMEPGEISRRRGVQAGRSGDGRAVRPTTASSSSNPRVAGRGDAGSVARHGGRLVQEFRSRGARRHGDRISSREGCRGRGALGPHLLALHPITGREVLDLRLEGIAPAGSGRGCDHAQAAPWRERDCIP